MAVASSTWMRQRVSWDNTNAMKQVRLMYNRVAFEKPNK